MKTRRCSYCGHSYPDSDFVAPSGRRYRSCFACRKQWGHQRRRRNRTADGIVAKVPHERGVRHHEAAQRIAEEIASRMVAGGIALNERYATSRAILAALRLMPSDSARRYVHSMHEAQVIGFTEYEPKPMPPLDLPAGSPEKIRAMRERLERGEAAMGEEELYVEAPPSRTPTVECGMLARQRGRHRVEPVAMENK